MLFSATFKVIVRTNYGRHDGTDEDIGIWVKMASGRWIYLGILDNPHRDDLEPGRIDTFYYYGNYVSSATDYPVCIELQTYGNDAYRMYWLDVVVRGGLYTFWNSNDIWLSTDGSEGYSSYVFC